jgi:hypothetical protein
MNSVTAPESKKASVPFLWALLLLLALAVWQHHDVPLNVKALMFMTLLAITGSWIVFTNPKASRTVIGAYTLLNLLMIFILIDIQQPWPVAVLISATLLLLHTIFNPLHQSLLQPAALSIIACAFVSRFYDIGFHLPDRGSYASLLPTAIALAVLFWDRLQLPFNNTAQLIIMLFRIAVFIAFYYSGVQFVLCGCLAVLVGNLLSPLLDSLMEKA